MTTLSPTKPSRGWLESYRERMRERLLSPLTPQGARLIDARHVYILPTRQAFAFAGLLLAMWVGALNYEVSLAYALAFLLVGLGVAGMFWTFRNLVRLTVSAGKTDDTFAGHPCRFSVVLHNPTPLPKWSLAALVAGAEPVYVDLAAGQGGQVELSLPTRKRGPLPLPRVSVFTRYPLGLFHAWSYAALDMTAVIYPPPEADPPPLPLPVMAPGTGDASGGEGAEDFSGYRPYVAGDNLARVDWKAVARDRGWFLKQFTGSGRQELWLNWDATPASMDTEQRLERLTAWVLAADARQLAFGLRLPGVEVAPGQGQSHRRLCLQTLALFGWGP